MGIPLRDIVSSEFYQSKYSKWGQGSRLFRLSCGHEVRRKGSAALPTKMRCRDCDDLSQGSVTATGNIVETWDPVAQLPVRIECTNHGVTFDEAAAEGLSTAEIRTRWPRLDGKCPKCCYFGIAYASMAHFVYGDW